MASCSLGAPTVKLPNLNFGRARIGDLQQWNGARTWIGRGQVQFARLAVSREAKKAFRICCRASVEAKIEEAVAHTADDSGEAKLSGSGSKSIPNSSQVQSLVSDICDTTSIAEFELKLGGFRLYVKRNSAEKSTPPAQPFSTPVVESVSAPASSPPAPASAPGDLNGSASTSLAFTKPSPTLGGIRSFLARAADEGLVIVSSPRVGYFRRSRTIKGKRAPPPCKEKQIVKEGQVVCFIEQLGGELPIKSDVAGEVIRILKEDGEPVGYGDALVAILPSFPGIKMLH